MGTPTPTSASGPDAPSPAAAPPGWWRTEAVSLALQLLVVFVGVYAAFSLDGCREDAQAEVNEEQLRALLIGEVESVAFGLDLQRARFDSLFVAPFATASDGDRPIPRPYYQINGDLSSPELQALVVRGIGNESTDLLAALRLYNQSIQYHLKISDHLRAFSVDRVAPALGDGPAAFYEPSGALKPAFRPYLSLIGQHLSSMEGAVVAAERVGALLREAGE